MTADAGEVAMRCLRLVAILLTVQAMGAPAHAGAVPRSVSQELPDLVSSLLKSVINISVLKKAGSDPTDSPNQIIPDRAQGSGFVVSADGYIVTNEHVVEGGYDVTVSFVDGSTFPADIVATNQRPDLALLKIEAGRKLPYVSFGNSDTLRIGETVLAIGNPLGLSSSLSVGVVSALNRDANMTMIDDFIQTDAAINHGNSGGPLFNLKGDVIGVNYAIFAPGQQSGSAGLGLAIPSNDAAWIVEQMRLHGKVQAGFVGFRLQQVTPDIQLALGLKSRTGGIVSRVVPNAPASGIMEEGDVVLALNGREPHDVRALLRSLSANPPGSRVTLSVWRGGAEKSVDLVLGKWPNNLFDPSGPQPDRQHQARQITPDLGLKLAVADENMLHQSPLSAGEPAVAIIDVSANSPAADLRLLPGDLILRVGTDRVVAPNDVWGKLDKARTEHRTNILMLVEARGAPRWIVMPLSGH